MALVAAAKLIPGAAAYLTYTTLQTALDAAPFGLTLYLGPLHAAAVAAVFLGEAIKVYHVMGAVTILPEIYIASRLVKLGI